MREAAEALCQKLTAHGLKLGGIVAHGQGRMIYPVGIVESAFLALPLPAEGWLPGDTCPTDGSEVLIWDEDNDEYAIASSFGDGKEVKFSINGGGILFGFPKYWMPLPARPYSEEG